MKMKTRVSLDDKKTKLSTASKKTKSENVKAKLKVKSSTSGKFESSTTYEIQESKNEKATKKSLLPRKNIASKNRKLRLELDLGRLELDRFFQNGGSVEVKFSYDLRKRNSEELGNTNNHCPNELESIKILNTDNHEELENTNNQCLNELESVHIQNTSNHKELENTNTQCLNELLSVQIPNTNNHFPNKLGSIQFQTLNNQVPNKLKNIQFQNTNSQFPYKLGSNHVQIINKRKVNDTSNQSEESTPVFKKRKMVKSIKNKSGKFDFSTVESKTELQKGREGALGYTQDMEAPSNLTPIGTNSPLLQLDKANDRLHVEQTELNTSGKKQDFSERRYKGTGNQDTAEKEITQFRNPGQTKLKMTKSEQRSREWRRKREGSGEGNRKEKPNEIVEKEISEVTPKGVQSYEKEIVTAVENLLQSIGSENERQSGTVADSGQIVYFKVKITKKICWGVSALMIILPKPVISNSARVCLIVPDDDFICCTNAIEGLGISNRAEVLTMEVLRKLDDDERQKLCKDFDLYLAKKSVYEEVIQCLGRHILPHRFPVFFLFPRQGSFGLKECIRSGFKRTPLRCRRRGNTVDIVVGDTEINSAVDIVANVSAIVKWLSRSFFTNVIQSLHIEAGKSHYELPALSTAESSGNVEGMQQNTHNADTRKVDGTNKEKQKKKEKKKKKEEQKKKEKKKKKEEKMKKRGGKETYCLKGDRKNSNSSKKTSAGSGADRKNTKRKRRKKNTYSLMGCKKYFFSYERNATSSVQPTYFCRTSPILL